MSESQRFSSFSCELRTIEAKNTEFIPRGKLFVRYYLSAGNGQRIQLNTREISSETEFYWNESFSLQCSGSQDFMHSLKTEGLVLELRRRNTTSVLGRMFGSQLVGRAEIPWNDIFESSDMEMEKWIPLNLTRSVEVKPPAIRVAVKVRVPAMEENAKKKKQQRLKKSDRECGCNEIGCSCSGNDIFAIAAALEGL